MGEFEDRLSNLSERVLKKNSTEEEQTNYSESLFESIKHTINRWPKPPN